MVDVGIGNHNLSFITLVLIAQLVLFVTQLAVEFIRSWIVLHTSTRISISLISDFLIKLMKLPLGYFDTKTNKMTEIKTIIEGNNYDFPFICEIEIMNDKIYALVRNSENTFSIQVADLK